MSASCEMRIKFTGSEDDFEIFLERLKELEGYKTFKFTHNPHYPFTVKGFEIYAENGGCRNIWGESYLEPDEYIFAELAKSVPNSSFTVDSPRVYEGGGGGCETYLKVAYENNRLTLKTQCMVDTMSLAELCSSEWTDDEYTAVAIGDFKYFDSIEDLKDYFDDYDVELLDEFDVMEANYIICNHPERYPEIVQQAKDCGIKILSDAAAIRQFGDVYDFDEEVRSEIACGITYQEFQEMYELDDDVTEEAFESAKETEESFILYNDNHVGFEGPWEEFVYELQNGEFVYVGN